MILNWDIYIYIFVYLFILYILVGHNWRWQYLICVIIYCIYIYIDTDTCICEDNGIHMNVTNRQRMLANTWGSCLSLRRWTSITRSFWCWLKIRLNLIGLLQFPINSLETHFFGIWIGLNSFFSPSIVGLMPVQSQGWPCIADHFLLMMC